MPQATDEADADELRLELQRFFSDVIEPGVMAAAVSRFETTSKAQAEAVATEAAGLKSAVAAAVTQLQDAIKVLETSQLEIATQHQGLATNTAAGAEQTAVALRALGERLAALETTKAQEREAQDRLTAASNRAAEAEAATAALREGHAQRTEELKAAQLKIADLNEQLNTTRDPEALSGLIASALQKALAPVMTELGELKRLVPEAGLKEAGAGQWEGQGQEAAEAARAGGQKGHAAAVGDTGGHDGTWGKTGTPNAAQGGAGVEDGSRKAQAEDAGLAAGQRNAVSKPQSWLARTFGGKSADGKPGRAWVYLLGIAVLAAFTGLLLYAGATSPFFAQWRGEKATQADPISPDKAQTNEESAPPLARLDEPALRAAGWNVLKMQPDVLKLCKPSVACATFENGWKAVAGAGAEYQVLRVALSALDKRSGGCPRATLPSDGGANPALRDALAAASACTGEPAFGKAAAAGEGPSRAAIRGLVEKLLPRLGEATTADDAVAAGG